MTSILYNIDHKTFYHSFTILRILHVANGCEQVKIAGLKWSIDYMCYNYNNDMFCQSLIVGPASRYNQMLLKLLRHKEQFVQHGQKQKEEALVEHCFGLSE